MARELTDKQKRVLSTLEAYWSQHQVPPSISDLAKQLGINKATAYEHLLALKKKGYLVHQARAGRTWRLAQHHKSEQATGATVPLLNKISSTTPLLASINVDAYLASDYKDVKSIFAFRVQDDTMIKAHIVASDIVFVDPKAEVKHRDLVLALVDNTKPVVRRYEQTPLKILLITEGDNALNFELGSDPVSIVGKIIEIRRIAY